MRKFLIASHGKLASGIQSSVKILTGMDDQLAVVDAYLDDSDYSQAIQNFITELAGATGVVFTDIIGGSVNQKVLLLAEQAPNILIVTGVNLPVVLSVLLNTEPLTKAVIKKLIADSQVSLVEPTTQAPEDEQDFFE